MRKKRKTKYDWSEIQRFYDDNGTYESIREKFGVHFVAIMKAVKRGDLITRPRSEAVTLAHKKFPDSYKRSEETKQKISKARKKFLAENPDKVPYVLNHYSKGPSYPEAYFLECFKGSGLIEKHRILNYELDFCDLEKKVNIEIDGDQHYLDKRIVKHDIKRNAALVELGWVVFRVKWSLFQKMDRAQKEFVVNSLINLIDPEVDCVTYFK